MKPLVAYILIASTAFADCRVVQRVQAVYGHQQQYNYGHNAKLKLVAVDDYHVTYVASDARSRNQIKELEAKVSKLEAASEKSLKESEVLREAIRLTAQGAFAARGADPGVLQTQAPIADPLFAKALPVLQKHCIQCHKAGAEQGETALFQSNGSPLPSYSPALKGLIELSVADDSMPKTGTKLTPDEYQVVRAWAVQSDADRAALRAIYKKAAKSNPIPPVPGELK